MIFDLYVKLLFNPFSYDVSYVVLFFFFYRETNIYRYIRNLTYKLLDEVGGFSLLFFAYLDSRFLSLSLSKKKKKMVSSSGILVKWRQL